MKKYLPLLLFACLFIMAFQCEDDAPVTKEQEQEELVQLRQEIQDLASQSVCDESTVCKFIAFGSKPCGGPWSYLIYSTSVNTEQLEIMVEAYNKKESDYNTKYNVFSDCSVALPPSGFNCENNSCVPVY